MITVKLEGFAELDRQLRRLPREMQEKALKQTTREGANVVAKAARTKAPIGVSGVLSRILGGKVKHTPGLLRKSIKVARATSKTSVYEEKYVVHLGKAWYGRLVELGHRIVVGGRLGKGGKVIGNVPAHPFLRPAFDENEGKIFDAMKAKLTRFLAGYN